MQFPTSRQPKPIALLRIAAASAVVSFCCASTATAHDFWVQPTAFWIQPLAATPVTLQVGHGPSRQRSPIPVQRITRFDVISENGATIDQRSWLHLGGSDKDGELQFQKPGVYVVVLQTDDHAQTHLPAIRFNDYLKTEGLTPAIEERDRRRRTDMDGSENYSRCAKTIVHVGAAKAGTQAQVTQPVGLPLEIVPEVSPYAEPRSANLPVRILYEGRPLAGALVKLTRLEDDALPFETHLTDKAGRAVFVMPKTGTWLLNVIWTKPQPRSAETDFSTIFSSLSFGFPSN